MTDSISRKEAIDAVCKVCLVCDYNKCKGRNHFSKWCEEITALREVPSAKPKWISTKEQLPDTYTAVLVSDGKYIWIDSLEDDFDSSGKYVVWWDSSSSVDFDKTAWMPLPELFKGDE